MDAEPASSPSHDRKIIHVDMDAFFASVEQRDDRNLRGRPVVVGGQPQSRGVVAAASYEARRFGVRSAMPCAQAYRLCPQAVFVNPDFKRYKAASNHIRRIFKDVTELVEPLALDEAYLDVTEAAQASSATELAEAIRQRIAEELRLTASAGVAHNKLVAKIASDANKPNGLCVVPPAAAAHFLAPLPVRRLPGIGPKAEARCDSAGLRLIADLRYAEAGLLKGLFGNQAEGIRKRAWGIDHRAVHTSRHRRSISIEDTFASDLTERPPMHAKLKALAQELAARCERAGVSGGRTITLKVRYADFSIITRSRSFSHSQGRPERWAAIAIDLLQQTDAGRIPVRLLGLGLSHLDDQVTKQLELPFMQDLPDEA